MAYKANWLRLLLVIPAAVLILATATADAQSDERINVQAENGSFDAERNATHLKENVRISRGEMWITADEGFAYRGEEGVERVELFGAPVSWRTWTEEGGETTGQADKVVYDLLANTVTLDGDARIQERRGSFTGQRLVYNLDTRATEGEGGINMTIEPEAKESKPKSGESLPPDNDQEPD